jgi:hypothetical protein
MSGGGGSVNGDAFGVWAMNVPPPLRPPDGRIEVTLPCVNPKSTPTRGAPVDLCSKNLWDAGWLTRMGAGMGPPSDTRGTTHAVA